MKLEVHDRLLILSVLPKEGGIVTLRVTKDLIKDVGFSEYEIKEFELKQNDNGSVSWNKEKSKEKEISIGETGKSIIAKALKKLSEENKLSMEYIGIYDRFVED